MLPTPMPAVNEIPTGCRKLTRARPELYTRSSNGEYQWLDEKEEAASSPSLSVRFWCRGCLRVNCTRKNPVARIASLAVRDLGLGAGGNAEESIPRSGRKPLLLDALEHDEMHPAALLRLERRRSLRQREAVLPRVPVHLVDALGDHVGPFD